MNIYHSPDGNTPMWLCGHWNGSPLEIGLGVRRTVGDDEVRHYHPYREYYVVVDGEAELEVGGTLVPLRAGMVVMVEPGEWYHVTAIGAHGARWIVIKERSEPNTKFVS